MVKVKLALAALLALAGALCAELKIVGETAVPANKLVRLKAEGAPPGAAYFWDIVDEDKADPEESGARLIFAAEPGTYKVKLRAISLGKDGTTQVETARVVVTVGKPAPKPDDPPGPGPVDPADALAKACQEAYAKERDADALQLLASLYDVTSSPASLRRAATWGDLSRQVTDARKSLIGEKLKGLREGPILEHLNATFPREPLKPIDDAGRTLAAATYKRLAAILGGLK